MRWLLVVGFLLAMTPIPASAASSMASAPSETAMSQLSGCVKERGALSVLMLIDESRSLMTSDKDANRVTAAKVALDGLRQLTDPATMEPTKPVQVRVSVAGFAREFKPGEWRDLATAAGPIQTELDGFKTRNQIVGTDYAAALRGARQRLAEHAASATAAGGKPPCQALLWFTDGAYDPLDGAPGNQEMIDRGTHELCDQGGVLDQLRQDRVPLLTVALTKDIAVADQEFLQRLTLSCGRQAGPQFGVYLPASDAASMVDAFADLAQKIRTAGEPAQLCPPGKQGCSFELDAVLRNFYVVIHTGGAGASLYPPDGSAVDLTQPGVTEARDVAGAKLRWAWFGADLVKVYGNLPRSDVQRWRGTWKVGFTGGSGQPQGGQVYLVGDLEPKIVREPRFVRGEQWTLAVRTLTSAGTQVELNQIRPELRVSIADGEDRRPARTTTEPDGTTAVAFDPPPEWHSSEVTLTVELSVRTPSNIDISPAPLIKGVKVITPLMVDPPSLALPSVLGSGSTEGKVRIGAQATGGCVWADAGQARFAAMPVRVTMTTTPEASSADGCLRVEPGQTKDLTFRFEVDHGWTGRADGKVALTVRPDGGAEYQSDVPVSFALDIRKGADFWVKLGAFGLLGLFPIAVLALVNFLALARFQHATALRAAVIPVQVKVTARGIQVRPDDGIADWPRPDQFRPLPRRTKHLLVGSGKFAVKFTAKASKNPFKSPYTKLIATAKGHVVTLPEPGREAVVRKAKRKQTGLPLELAGLTVLTAKADTTAAEFPAEVVVVLGNEQVTTDKAKQVRDEVRDLAGRLIPAEPPASVETPA